MSETTMVRRAITVRTATTILDLEEHAAVWDRLALDAPERMPMLSHAWVASYLEHCTPPGAGWRCLFAYAGEELVGVLVLIRSRPGLRRHLEAPEDTHTIVGHPLLAPAHAAEALRALVRACFELEPHLWMRFYGVRAGSPVLRAAGALRGEARVLTTPGYLGSLVDTSEPFDVFSARLSSSFKRSIRSARKRLEREHTLSFEFVGGPEAADPALLQEFLRVEASGWKGAGGSAIACSPRRVAFYTALARRLAHRGWLEWNLARVDGRVAAAHFGVRFDSSVLLPKGGYDEAYAGYAPGNLLFWELFTRAFADPAIDDVNFQTDKPWMQLWKMRQDSYAGLVVTPREPVATLSALLAAAEPRRRASDYAREHPEVQQLVDDTRDRWREVTRRVRRL
jgi:CelD/BcsL family acetyltransferase involved in cellulose biosynthesis